MFERWKNNIRSFRRMVRIFLFSQFNFSDQFYKFILRGEKYGPCFKFQFFGRMMIITTEPQAIKEICVTRNFPKNSFIYNQIGFPYKQRLFYIIKKD
jgi:hypothetical protein